VVRRDDILPAMVLPSPRTVLLVVRVTTAAAVPVVRHGDLRAVRHLPFVLTHLDDAAVVAGAISDPVGTAVGAPAAAARFGVRGVRAAPGAALRGGGAVVRTPGRVVRGGSSLVGRSPLRRR
jgi:hypothetical protein